MTRSSNILAAIWLTVAAGVLILIIATTSSGNVQPIRHCNPFNDVKHGSVKTACPALSEK